MRHTLTITSLAVAALVTGTSLFAANTQSMPMPMKGYHTMVGSGTIGSGMKLPMM